MKQATSKNIEHLQQAINVQQMCTATICTYINSILPHIMKLKQTVLQLQQKVTTEQDTVQINAPDIDLDTDGPKPPRSHTNTVVVSVQEHFTSPEPEVLDAAESQEDNTARESSDFICHSSEESHGYEDFSQDIQNHTTAQYQITTEFSDEIPELEEDWDNGQFADAKTTLITRHNTHSESERIRRDYTQQLLDLLDNQYYEEETPVNQLQYSSPDPDYYGLQTRRSQKMPRDSNGYYPPLPDPVDIQCWHACGRGKRALLHGHRLFGEKTRSAESRKARKRWQNYRQRIRKLSF